MTEKKKEGGWSVTISTAGVVISLVSLVVMLDSRTRDSAQWQERISGRMSEAEAKLHAHDSTLKSRARFVNEATNQLNYLCTTAKTCRQLFAPIEVPE